MKLIINRQLFGCSGNIATNVSQISEGKGLETKNFNLKTEYNMKTRTSIYHRTFAFAYVLLVAVFSFFKKVFTHNYCDTCGFTKDKVYVTEIFTEAGIIQCDKCSGQNCH
jgi:hypothetical protein